MHPTYAVAVGLAVLVFYEFAADAALPELAASDESNEQSDCCRCSDVHIYTDDGVSGDLFANRAESQRMMRDAAAVVFGGEMLVTRVASPTGSGRLGYWPLRNRIELTASARDTSGLPEILSGARSGCGR